MCFLFFPLILGPEEEDSCLTSLIHQQHLIIADSALSKQGPHRFTFSQANHIRFLNNHVCVRPYKEVEQNTRSIFSKVDGVIPLDSEEQILL